MSAAAGLADTRPVMQEVSPPSVVIADDHRPMRELIARMLGARVRVVASVGDGRALVDAARELAPDLLITDIDMPRVNGIDAVRELRALGIVTPVVMVTISADQDLLLAAQDAGASGYVVKSSLATDLRPAIACALRGEPFASELA